MAESGKPAWSNRQVLYFACRVSLLASIAYVLIVVERGLRDTLEFQHFLNEKLQSTGRGPSGGGQQ